MDMSETLTLTLNDLSKPSQETIQQKYGSISYDVFISIFWIQLSTSAIRSGHFESYEIS